MNFEDMIRAEHERAVEKWGGTQHDDEHTIEEWTLFIARYLKDAKDADGCNDPGAAREALVKAGGLVLSALRSHGRKWHYGEPASERAEARTALARTQRSLGAAERELAAIREVHLKYGEEIGNTPIIEELELDGADLATNVCHELTNILGVWISDCEAAQKRAKLAEEKVERCKVSMSDLQGQIFERDERIKKLEAKPNPTIDQRIEQLADLELELANAYATRATDDFAEVEARCWDLEKAEGHYRRREQLLKEWGEEEDR